MSERARALEQAREWQAIAYGDRPETWAALDYYRELGWPVDSNKFPERERVEGRIFAFMSGYREALKAAVDHPPPSGASSQAETVAKLLLAARQVASFARAWEPLSPGDIRDLTKAIEAMDALPAPVSPVEPTGASPFRLTDWIPTAGCDCEKCTAQREAEPPTGASPQAETRAGESSYRIRAYRCEDCHGWHVTNSEKRASGSVKHYGRRERW